MARGMCLFRHRPHCPALINRVQQKTGQRGLDRPVSQKSQSLHALGRQPSTTAGFCGLSFLPRRCEAMSRRSEAEDWAEELEAVAGRIAPRFGRAEPRRRALAYLQGLLAPLERKNDWHLAEAAGDHTPDGMQEFLARVHWDADGGRRCAPR